MTEPETLGASERAEPTTESGSVTVAALYVETNGVYYGLPDVDPWDEARDARKYDGPYPVVAHPPCTRWCCFARANETRFGYKVGDDDGCFEAALHAVRTHGGVLEHPALSLAWNAYGLPKPKSSHGWTTSMDDDGASCYVEQGRYGHAVRKATWLYAVLADLPTLRWGRTNDDTLGATSWGSYYYKTGRQTHMQGRPRVTPRIANGSPDAFRDVLIDMARSASLARLNLTSELEGFKVPPQT